MRLHTYAASNPKIVLNDLPSCRHQHAIGIAAAQLSAIKEGSLLATAPREEMFSKNNRVLAISSIVFNFFLVKSHTMDCTHCLLHLRVNPSSSCAFALITSDQGAPASTKMRPDYGTFLWFTQSVCTISYCLQRDGIYHW